jgi:2-polyprenyl-6-methoxyphenol hydroxylase-like FAD-dependent oxidoreductase
MRQKDDHGKLAPVSARTAVVVGGGIGGLASAVALRSAGWEVRVLERGEALREVGAGITLWPNALHALDLLGVGGRVRAQGVIEAGAGFRDQAGSWLFRTDTRALEQRYGPSILIRRSSLLAILADALPPGAVTLSTEVTGIVERPDHVRVEHRAGTAPGDLTADLVVAADGIRSRIRALLWPGARGPRYVGYTTWRFVTPVLDIDAEVTESWGRGERVGIFPFGDGTFYSYLSATIPPDHSVGDELGELKRRFAGWHAPIPTLLDSITAADVLRHDIYRLPPLRTFVTRRVALVGDAAHAMTPDLGQGGCMSLEDAVELARRLDDGSADPAAGLARYDRLRRRRTQAIARRSAISGRFAQGSSPAAARLRDRATRLLPHAAFLRSLEPVFSWR